MRAVNDRDVALYGAPYGQQATWVKLEIDRDNGGNWVDLTDYYGDDWLVGLQYQGAIGRPAMSATITLRAHQRVNPAYSLVSTMYSSALHTGGTLLQKHRRIRASVATVPMNDGKPSVLDEVFDGRIDKWSAKGGNITVECRCMMVDLLSRFVELEQNYGTDDPTTATAADLEEVIQNILDDHINTTASAPRANPLVTRTTDGAPWQLYSDDGDGTTAFKKSTGAAVLTYQQAKETIWAAIKKNADAIQWRLSRRWLNFISDWALVFEQPTRTGASAVLTVDPKTSQARITSIGFDGIVVRNVIQVGYQKAGGTRDVYEATDATSVTEYGRQWLGLDLGATSQINTAAEATLFGDGALDDCKDPVAQVQLQMPYIWYVQLNDVLTVAPDDINLDASLDLAVIAYTHSIQQGGASVTSLTLEGSPNAGNRELIQQQRVYPPFLKRVPTAFTWSSSMHTNGNFYEDERV